MLYTAWNDTIFVSYTQYSCHSVYCAKPKIARSYYYDVKMSRAGYGDVSSTS